MKSGVVGMPCVPRIPQSTVCFLPQPDPGGENEVVCSANRVMGSMYDWVLDIGHRAFVLDEQVSDVLLQ